MTRVVKTPQAQLGEIAISAIKINPRSRDDIPQILQGLQYLYITPLLKTALFSALEKLIPAGIDSNRGRPGMELWRIFVMGTLRLNINWDYDRLHEMVNCHITIREMLGHSGFGESYKYSLQTIKDNVALITPEILDEINQVVVNAGHDLVKKKETEPTLRGRGDSFVVETDVHYPTDLNLLYDAMRKVIASVSQESERGKAEGWRQYQYNIRQVKKAYRKAEKSKRGGYKDQDKETRRIEKVKEAHKNYIELANDFLQKALKTQEELQKEDRYNEINWLMIADYIHHANRQIDQISRRVLDGEIIPHSEKVFSLFEPHTEWISKGKAKAPVELGLRVCIMEDQFGFVLHHRVMEKEADVHIAIPMVKETKERFPNFIACSYDKGFYSKDNKAALKEELNTVILPKKGRLNKQEKEEESNPDYIKRRYQHAAVESGINALEVHGLDRCLDHGLDGFKRYVALAVVARNIQQIGAILRSRKKQRLLIKKAA